LTVAFVLLLAVLALSALTLPAASATPASTTGRAAVEIVQISPITVAGRGFKPKERIRVTANGRRKFVTAGRRGRFEVAFPAANACNGVLVVAVGSKGSRASVAFSQLSNIHCLEP
jgi:hypothetical protein